MLSREDNERVTRVGPGTPMGAVFRRYWLPAALSSELPEPDGAPVRVRMLGEDLIAFRSTDGTVGLVDAYCPHRRAPMFFGRNEECGLRCVYHGWKFEVHGACVDMPSEPPDSLFKTKVRIAAYPTLERGGIVWAYLGPAGSEPPPPDYELLRAPETHRHVSKTFESCNYLQALEGGLDTAHISFLHRMKLGASSDPRAADTAPRLDVERTDYGFRYAGIRLAGDQQYVRVYHYFMPAQQCRPFVIGHDGRRADLPTVNGHIWVPIDDEHTFVYNWLYSYDTDKPLTREYAIHHETFSGRGPDDVLPDFRLKRNRDNDYLIDRAVQKTRTFTGITGINTQDFALQEGMGPIVDRSKEHLGTTDRAIIAVRALLLEAVDDLAAGRPLRGLRPADYADKRATDVMVPKDGRWQTFAAGEVVARY